MGVVIALDDPYDKARVHRRIKKLLLEGEIMFHPHAQVRMRSRQLDTSDVLNVLRYGQITEITQTRNNWRYRMEGQTVERQAAGCVVEINGGIMIVTIFEIGRWTR